MADEKKLVKQNIAGNFFVDTTCINCDTCRQLAPVTFDDQGQYSFVKHQPKDGSEAEAAMRALLACPVGSIGNRAKVKPDVASDFPMHIVDDVYYCGYNSALSYGGNSFFIKHKDGNWLIDSPRYSKALAERLSTMGGISTIFLTHRDDVADAEKWARHFNSADTPVSRIIHKDELSAQPDAEIVLQEDREFGPDFKIIATPGHTKGHMVLLFKNHVLLTGDHLSVDTDTGQLEAHDDYCWYSFAEQIKSMEKLAKYQFDWVLAGHGRRGHLPEPEMHKQMLALVERMKRHNKASRS
jgi:glyoxylase-like metal-dependent hydrolase (beta-lactamase superfamily II)/ferredoxin